MKNLGDDFAPSPTVDAASLPVACRWLLSRLSATAAAVDAAMEAYDFGSAAQVSLTLAGMVVGVTPHLSTPHMPDVDRVFNSNGM